MKKLPHVFGTSTYKYNIIARLMLLPGAESNIDEKKRKLIQHLQRKGYAVSTVKDWLVIEMIATREIPCTALFVIRDYFNQKYKEQEEEGTAMGYQAIDVEDLHHPQLLSSKSDNKY